MSKLGSWRLHCWIIEGSRAAAALSLAAPCPPSSAFCLPHLPAPLCLPPTPLFSACLPASPILCLLTCLALPPLAVPPACSFLRFSREVSPDLSNYADNPAWPLLLDNFVDWMQLQQHSE